MQRVIDYLKQNEPRFVEELCEYVRSPSVSAQPQRKPDLQACAEWVENRCRQIGLETRLCPTQGNPIIIAKTPAHRQTAAPVLPRPKADPRKGRGQLVPAKDSLNQAMSGDKLSPPRPHFLVYGHYDSPPPEPFYLLKSPPFEPRIQGRSLVARGSSDNKGQNLAHLKAIEPS